jgi:hypothetical protein
MYLHKRTWLGGEARERLTMNGLPDSVEPSRVNYVVEAIGYWRKANAIHLYGYYAFIVAKFECYVNSHRAISDHACYLRARPWAGVCCLYPN